MTLVEDIQSAVKSGKAIIGYRKSIKFVKIDSPKLVVIAKNIPDKMRKEVEHNTKVANVKLEIFEGNSKDLGVICGKPFPVSTIVIKG